MTDIRFYHLVHRDLEQILPDLLEKTLSRQWKAVVMAGSEERVEALANHLWTYRADSFLPHGTAKDGHAEDQPIWITTGDECPNKASVLFLTDGATAENIGHYERVCVLFDGRDDVAVAAARKDWARYKAETTHALSYWQYEDGVWVNKAG